MRIDQNRAAQLTGIARWRAVYHFTDPDRQPAAETVAWFELNSEAALAEAAAQLPPAGYSQPHTVTIERGTFRPAPEGGHTGQPLGDTLQATSHPAWGLVIDLLDSSDLPATPDELTAVGQQTVSLWGRSLL